MSIALEAPGAPGSGLVPAGWAPGPCHCSSAEKGLRSPAASLSLCGSDTEAKGVWNQG